MGRTPCCDKTKVKRGPWSPQEDTILQNFVQTHGSAGNWIALPQKAGLKRCGKSCRLRWLNYLRPDIKHGGFTHEEDNLILTLYLNIGSRWSVIASHLQGRTDNDVKNYWNTKLKKKLAQHMHSRSATTTNIWNVPGGNSMLLPKAESNYDYETREHRSNVMNSATTTSFPYPMDMNYDQEMLGRRPKIVLEISDTKDPMSIINFNEEEVIENGTSYTPFSRSLNSTSHQKNCTPIAVSPTFSLENSDYASWSGEGFLDRFEYIQEEINEFGNNIVAYSSNNPSQEPAHLSRNYLSIASRGLYQSAINGSIT